MKRGAVVHRVASRFDSLFLRNYARSKLRTDPLYEIVARTIPAHPQPVIDVGCGIGLTEFWLRETGFAGRLVGIDHDSRKIEAARRAARGDAASLFLTGDARDPLPEQGSVLVLDLLQYFADGDQRRILANAAAAVAPQGTLVVRAGISDGSWRYAMTATADRIGRRIRWMRGERINFPTRQAILNALPAFDAEVVPAWGATPFNNYLFVFRRSADGIVKS